MKRTKTNILCLLLAALMLFSLTACGKGCLLYTSDAADE